jgi:DNA-directed RNA polymerase specialized sigma24 family protein
MAERGEEIGADRVLVALLALIAADRDDRVAASGTGRRSELVLADAGLTVSEIAKVTGRKYEAVKTAIRRARLKENPSSTGTEALNE